MTKSYSWIYWTCDKRNCGRDNHRQLEKGMTVVSDYCEHCGQYIREPITISIDYLTGASTSKNDIKKF